MSLVGKDFEYAVHSFVARLLPGAKVLFDHRVPDRDTGALRQVDVWVEGQIAGHFPITVHISCKDYARKINVAQMGTFINEVQSTGASTGIIYSRKGFSRDAVRKAKAHGLSCCRLYHQTRVDLPSIVWVWNFLCVPQYKLVAPSPDERGVMVKWEDLLLQIVGQPSRRLADVLDEQFKTLEASITAATQTSGGPFPQATKSNLRVQPEDGGRPFTIGLVVEFRYFRGRMDAHVADGSYCMNNGQFSGSVAGPAVDLRALPGPGWEEIIALPERQDNLAVITLAGGTKSISHPEPWWSVPFPS